MRPWFFAMLKGAEQYHLPPIERVVCLPDISNNVGHVKVF